MVSPIYWLATTPVFRMGAVQNSQCLNIEIFSEPLQAMKARMTKVPKPMATAPNRNGSTLPTPTFAAT